MQSLQQQLRELQDELKVAKTKSGAGGAAAGAASGDSAALKARIAELEQKNQELADALEREVSVRDSLLVGVAAVFAGLAFGYFFS